MMSTHIDALRERLLAPELAEARVVLSEHGVPALIERATAHLERAECLRRLFAELTRDIEGAPRHTTVRRTADYLQSVAPDAKAGRRDVQRLRRGEPGVLDLGALAERSACQVDALERRAEAHLAVAGAQALGGARVDLEQLLTLARTRGRWSRRTAALAVLRSLGRADLAPEACSKIIALTTRLCSAIEHRWVQPAALATLAVVDNRAAHLIAQERISSNAGADDFIVRASIVIIAARFQKSGWHDVISVAESDESELVRMTAVRAERRCDVLARRATDDPSGRVRARALLQLGKRMSSVVVDALMRALGDRDDLVVKTAAGTLVKLGKSRGFPDSEKPKHALWTAALRSDVSADTRAACADALLAFDVLTGPSRELHDALAALVAEVPAGQTAPLPSAIHLPASEEDLARVLAVIAQADFGLSVDRKRATPIVYRGDQQRFSTWRALFELAHPAPAKRQGFDHTSGKKPMGDLRAPPGGLAEVNASLVPGERVLVEGGGGWGRHLPLVDDLLSAGVLRPNAVRMSSAFGVTIVRPSASLLQRARGWWLLSRRYAYFASLRQQALTSSEAHRQTQFVREVHERCGITLDFAPFQFDVGRRVALPAPAELDTVAARPVNSGKSTKLGAAAILPVFGTASPLFEHVRDLWQDVVAYAASPGGNRLSHLASYGVVLLGALMVRAVAVRQGIDNDRDAIPLVIGGWGTRGKSGTERLKAAMFQGLGYPCLVKTTGCEAMFIHAIPGVAAREVFIYRPYDKATVWEQRDVLALARRLGVRVFLWECMALQSDLVNLLQEQWMQDDWSTITNAHPDHQDIQGPTGANVATAISEFVPRSGKLITAESQMLPVITERAKQRHSQVHVVSPRDAELIPIDLLARFGHAEHPSNIALVAELARRLGVSPLVAVVEMADNVVADLGALKTYPVMKWRGRTITFTNGMGANDQAGTLGNWQRSGFAAHRADAEPGRWIVTVVNNRADRVARSEVFARLIVQNLHAHRHVLIGTNVAGLLGLIQRALDEHVTTWLPSRDLSGDAPSRLEVATRRIAHAFAQLKVGAIDAASVRAESLALGFPEIDGARLDALLEPLAPGERYETASARVREGLGEFSELECTRYLVAAIARRRTVKGVIWAARESLAGNPTDVDRAFSLAYRAMFMESLVPLHDASITGDAIIDEIASALPPSVDASVMGIQNIKGTGLDFAYRWVSVEQVVRMTKELDSPDADARDKALAALARHDDYGVLDAHWALAAASRARARHGAQAAHYDAVIAKLQSVVEVCTRRATSKGGGTAASPIRRIVGETFDFADAMRRRRLSSKVLSDLVQGDISHATAAARMRAIVARTKGAWLRKHAPHRKT